MALLASARQKQPLLSKLLWPRQALALDVFPCRDIAMVAGTEGEHGVPVPEPIDELPGVDLERGLTRSMAQSCRVDKDSYGNTDRST